MNNAANSSSPRIIYLDVKRRALTSYALCSSPCYLRPVGLRFPYSKLLCHRDRALKFFWRDVCQTTLGWNKTVYGLSTAYSKSISVFWFSASACCFAGIKNKLESLLHPSTDTTPTLETRQRQLCSQLW